MPGASLPLATGTTSTPVISFESSTTFVET